jgi:hypothetical protein
MAQLQITSGTTVERGQLYGTLSLDYPAESSQALCKGYVYKGHRVTLGEFAEPGPAGGHGYIRQFTVVPPGAGSVPSPITQATNTIWLMNTCFANPRSDANRGYRLFEMFSKDSTGTTLFQVSSSTYNANVDVEIFIGRGLDRSPFLYTSGDTAVPRFGRMYVPAQTQYVRRPYLGQWKFDVSNIKGGDTFTVALTLAFEEWTVPY